MEGALETPINVELRKTGITPFSTRKMTGDETFQDVREVLSQVETNEDVFNGVNLIVATSMISHGVDADRFNIMFFYGMPGNTAEYIQAYSRTGRRHSSIVIDIIRPSRETDQSYLKNFVNFHEFKDIMVESVPINRWATKAIDCTLPGIFTGLLLTKYNPELQFAHSSLFFMNNIKDAIIAGRLDPNTVRNELKMVIEQKEEGLSVLLEGELGHHEALSALRSLEETISQQSPSRLELDFSGVSFMDSSGIALVVQSARQMGAIGGSLTVRGVSRQAMRVFDAAGIPRIVRFVGKEEKR